MAESKLKVDGKRTESAWKLDRKAGQGRASEPDIDIIRELHRNWRDSHEFADLMA